MLPDIPKDLLEVLEQITPNFEENLRRVSISHIFNLYSFHIYIQHMCIETSHVL